MLTITCFYYPECGSYDVLPTRLERALEEEGLSAQVSHRVISPEEGPLYDVSGSPTILIDGHDAFASPGQGVT